jgi:Zn-dependent protease
VLDEMAALRSGRAGWGANLLVLAVSLLLVLGAEATRHSWRQALALGVAVLLFHEAGHSVAMLVFGYRNARLFFVPFFGASVSGRGYDVAGWKQALVSLAGPVPGIAAGILLGLFGLAAGERRLIDAAELLLLLNGFNLLPLLPFDGGWVMHSILFSRRPLSDVAFRVLAAAGLTGLALAAQSVVLGLLTFALLVRVPLAYRLARLTAELQARGLSAGSTDGRSVPTDTALSVIHALGRSFPERATARAMAANALQVLATLTARPPGPLASLSLLGLYALAAAATLVGFAVLRG